MGGPSKERQWGETIRHAEQRARETRFIADVAACDAWNYRMKGYGGPAQPSPPIGDALNAGFRYLEVKCAGCSTHSTVDLTTLRRPGKHQSGSLNSGCVAGRVPRPAVIRTSARQRQPAGNSPPETLWSIRHKRGRPVWQWRRSSSPPDLAHWNDGPSPIPPSWGRFLIQPTALGPATFPKGQ